MSFFTAVMASDGSAWRARDVDVEDLSDLADLADTLRAVSLRDHPVIAVIEREDQWFALLRVDGEDDVRGFVSDSGASSRGHYAELLAPVAEQGPDLPEDAADLPTTPVPAAPAEPELPVDGDPADDELAAVVEPDDAEPEEPRAPVAPQLWAGDPDLLADLGCDGGALVELVVDNPDDPAAVLADLGEMIGFGDLLEALR